MAHQDHSPVVVDDLLLEPLNGVQVQMVGGLVENEYVGLLCEHPGEGDAFELTAGEVPCIGLDLSEHPETVQYGVNLPSGAQGLTYRAHRERGDLFQETDPYVASPADRTGIRPDRPGDDPKQRRLADAVDADHSDSIPRGDGQ